jgi:hypothetical protein
MIYERGNFMFMNFIYAILYILAFMAIILDLIRQLHKKRKEPKLIISLLAMLVCLSVFTLNKLHAFLK